MFGLTRTEAEAHRREVESRGLVSRRRMLGVVLFGYSVFGTTYLPINHWSVGRPAATLFLPGENHLPFVPEFEYLYVLTYVMPFLLVAYPPDQRGLRRTARAFALTLAVAYSTYLIYPVYFERPRFEVDGLATALIALEYLDPSYNHFPSLHVAVSWLIYLACRRAVKRPRLLAATVVGISVSTLFVKQHYVADVAYGVALAFTTWHLSRTRSMEP